MTTLSYHDLRDIPEPERQAILENSGLDTQKAADLLDYLRRSTQLPQEKREKKAETWADISARKNIPERIAALSAKSRAEQEDRPAGQPTDEQRRLFERDILVNRYLLGGSTIYDHASLNNSALIKTGVVQWFQAIRPRVALLIGSPGSGKTWGALAYMTSLTDARIEGRKVQWANSAFVTAFRMGEMFHDQRQYREQLIELQNKQHLLIDDLGAEPKGFRGDDFTSYFDNLFSERHKRRRCTYLTSNAKSTAEIREIYGQRFASRFAEVGSFYETSQADLRQAGNGGGP